MENKCNTASLGTRQRDILLQDCVGTIMPSEIFLSPENKAKQETLISTFSLHQFISYFIKYVGQTKQFS